MTNPTLVTDAALQKIVLPENTLLRRVITLMRLVSFVKENKWARENGIIERYKALPSLEEFSRQDHQKVVANIIRALIESEMRTAGVDPTKFEIKKERNSSNFRLRFNTDYHNRLGYMDIRNICAALDRSNFFSYYGWNMREYQTCTFEILGINLGMSRTQVGVNGTLEQLRTALRELFPVFAAFYPLPVVP